MVELCRTEVNPYIQSKIQDKKKPIFHLKTEVEEEQDEGGVVFITNHNRLKQKGDVFEKESTAGLQGMYCAINSEFL